MVSGQYRWTSSRNLSGNLWSWQHRSFGGCSLPTESETNLCYPLESPPWKGALAVLSYLLCVHRVVTISAMVELGIQPCHVVASYPHNAIVLGPHSPPAEEAYCRARWGQGVCLYQTG